MSFYDDMAATATELLTEFGLPLTLTRQSAGSYDPATGSATITTSTQPAVGLVMSWNSGVIDGSMIKAGDKQLLLSATGITAPVLGDTVTFDGVVHTLVDPLKPLSPAGVVVLYECNIRV